MRKLCLLLVGLCGIAQAVSLSVQQEVRVSRDDFVVAVNGTVVAYQSLPNEFLGDGDDFARYERSQIAVENLVTGDSVVASRYAAIPVGQTTFDKPAISPDGRYVAFQSTAGDYFWVDLENPEQSTRKIATGSRFRTGPLVSADGSEVAFVNAANQLEIINVHTAAREVVDFPEVPPTAEDDLALSVSLNQFVASDDFGVFLAPFLETDGSFSPPIPPVLRALFTYDRTTGSIETLVTLGSYGFIRDRAFAISGDGNIVAYATQSSNFTRSDVYRRDLRDGSENRLRRTSRADQLDLSFDGNHLAFVEGDGFGVVRQVFIWDASSEQIRLVSGTSPGKPGNRDSSGARVSRDGQKVLFNSESNNLSTPFFRPALFLAQDLNQIRLDGGSSGWWYNAEQSGHGFSILVLPNNRIVLLWFTYSDQGVPLWIYAEGTFNGAAAELDGFVSPLGAPPPAFSPDDISLDPVGTIRFEIEDCRDGRITWDLSLPGFGQGALEVSRLAQAETLTCL